VAADWNDLAGKLSESPLHPVAHDCSADLLADGEPDALGRIAVLAVADEKNESRRRRAPTGVRSEKIRALPKDC
jgi:hypothetical protein